MKYQQKPVVIQAVQWDGRFSSVWELSKEFGLTLVSLSCDNKKNVTCWRIETNKGPKQVQKNDWVITTTTGEHEIYDTEVFETMYENVSEKQTKEPTMTEDANGTKMWCLNGKLHRTDGPAIECVGGTKIWYVDGVFIKKVKSTKGLTAIIC